ncbi:hypothetical protein NP493_450g02061 [Ridgeia piscesae]|uniref:GH18 domain-containing protein n=1 Tax=Ridgeia piscesae TaxID=27915 RepID=A0AAD9KZ29_RIDPI|nr:hypothetical protein NP493_450g02061 [Ridgeia piscesae]
METTKIVIVGSFLSIFFHTGATSLHSTSTDNGPKEYKRVCYYTNWSQYRPGRGKFLPENVDPSLCTHIIYAFATMSGNRLAAYEWNDEDTAWSTGMYETSSPRPVTLCRHLGEFI